jgi:DNA polymerase elongation subunit (family B)
MKILHLDIETAPNVAHVWGLWQQNVGLAQLMESGYTMCWAAKWDGEDEIFGRSIHYDGEGTMLQVMHELLSEADAVVHYNGTKFDMPTLNKEFIKAGMAPPDPYHQIDLLQTARKRFRFASNKLDHVANELGLGQKVKHIGHEMWVQCMNGVEEAWDMMIEYNKQDVNLLELLYKRMLPWIQNHPNHALYVDADSPLCPNCGSTQVKKKGIETTKLGQYQRYRCKKCHTPSRGRTTVMDKEARKNVITQSKL